ncbi:hypothetical protein [Hydrogenophaga sp.]|uniref:hypothetical protein n=1 Tax=Hydrogenophaga sp. TaxID=1904254 RepID=UPI0027223034|nr:hypothetical protein [Hydrogenophaga sp.]MDO9437330.1 hypothetical protein [Hydrogenophaga sp.]
MSRTERTVNHLHLRAPTAQAVRQAVHGLEDALRCASLPDAGERVLLVRQLHLGKLPADLSSQKLSQLIEQRVAAVGRTWVHGDDEARAAHSDTVFFPNRLNAAKAAVRRHALGERMDGWHWPLALPGVDVHAPAIEFLLQLRDSVQQWPEAPAAMAALAEHGMTEVRDWWTAYAPPEWRDNALKIRVRREPAHEPMAHATQAQAPTGPRAAMSHRSADAPIDAGEPSTAQGGAPDAGSTASDTAVGLLPTNPLRSGPTVDPRMADHTADRPLERRGVAQDAVRSDARAPSSLLQPPPPELAFAMAAARAQAEAGAVAAPHSPVPMDASTRGAFLDATDSGTPLETQAGGLLFLWPLLQRVGFADWDATHPDAWMAPQVLRVALQRLSVPPDDPAWSMLASLHAGPRAIAEPDSGPSSAMWLSRCRQHARRVLHIGLASLVQRRAWLHWSDTHIDVHFRTRDADLRVRRAGLDIDLGWVDALQRVVGFHFDRNDR